MIRFLLPSLLLLGACVPVPDRAFDLSARTDFQVDNPLANTFAGICLAGDGSQAWHELAAKHGWIIADDALLAANGLQGLRRKILEVPGGGAHVSETQAVFIGVEADKVAALSLETSSSRDGGQSARCLVHFSKADHLALCASLGRLLGKAPDRNQRYTAHDAHFIGWDMHRDGRPVRIGCDKAALSPAQTGVVMSISIDLSVRTKPLQPEAVASPALRER